MSNSSSTDPLGSSPSEGDQTLVGSTPTTKPQSKVMSREKRNAFMFAFVVAIGGFIFGLDIMLISGTFQYITVEFGLTALQKGNIAAGPGYGALVALLFAGFFCERFGRKATLLTIAALYTVSAIGSAWAPSYTSLFLFRLIGGLAFTSLSVAAMYIGEIAPPAMRGKLVGMNQLNIAIGILAASLFNFWIVNVAETAPAWATAISLNEGNVWRWMLGMETIPAILWFILLFFIPESPRWLMLNGKHEKAEKVLRRITPADEVEEELKQIEENLKDTTHTIGFVEQVKTLMSKRMRIAVLIGLFMGIVQPLTGMNAALAFMPSIFAQTGGAENAFWNTMLVSFIGMFFTLAALLVIDKLGRRIILLGGLAACAAAMGLIGYGFSTAVYQITPEALTYVSSSVDTSLLQPLVSQSFGGEIEFKQAVLDAVGKTSYDIIESDLLVHSVSMNATLVLVGIIAFVCSYNFSVGPVLWILFSEIFPTKVRALAITSCGFVTSVFGGVVVPNMFPWQIENFGSATTFLIYGTFCTLGLAVMAKYTPETKGKTIEEIEQELAAKSLKS
ncbi:sugar porter family MFS transporter [Agaribacterium sp. ZY112]|uniref:sugar porter family MFS transporter n=1 Tax=Agaribacterium sp. ZY112 TaxID=3233574 RepID=UPI00352359A6